ncbi:MAG: DUF308 domain-containing protein [Clostridia bacterium]|nr:DUF308 domain-containing protein [Clostridia bacterium]
MAKAKKSNSAWISSILYIVIGILLIVFPGEALNIAMTIAGIVFLVSGILELIKKNWAGGIISLVIGVAILVIGWLLTDIVMLVLGIFIAIKGIIALVQALGQKKKKVLAILFPILTIVVGLLLAFAWGSIMNIVMIVGGILLIVSGVLGLVGALKK